MVKTITLENFETEVLQSEKPFLLDFFANWCGPCKMMAPIVDSLAEEMEGEIVVGKCDIDDELAIAQKYAVMSIPTFKIFKGGECIATTLGATSADDFAEWVEKALQ